jgi:peptide/nickel transport system permease protein
VLRIIVRRVLWSVPLLFVVSVLTFVLVSFVPGDAARTILGTNGTQAEYDALRQQLGLNLPLWDQYAHWLAGVLHGRLGNSVFNGEPVATLLDGRLVVSITLIVLATFLAAIVGISTGVTGAVRGGVPARALDALGRLGIAIPNFVVGLVLVIVVSAKLGLLPPTGFVSFSSSPLLWAKSLVLPVLTLSLAPMTIIAQQTRSSMFEVMHERFIRVLEANGIRRRSIIFRHALRNAAIPVVSVIGVVFVGLLSGTVLVETVFALPGLGQYAVQATEQHDIPVIQGISLYFTCVVIVVNLAVDLLYATLNPKVRAS